ncbi:GIY-YIG nuclease family protein [Garciella nitratireducens]|uniref:GIY-YIG nuclease family protein n=1 Tax=Garciella nitratireducens TaxID=218205 RepID=UPI000DE95231|nr:GIY-YIG nuclease family protein [Garciella nitratireducens]RBP45532.1 putative endonuclease [Garciella nitratireducens]
MPYAYIVKCNDGTYYTGWTTDLQKRMATHNKGKGAKYTYCRLPVKLIYWEWKENRSQAQSREVFIKKLSRQQKEKLIKEFQKTRSKDNNKLDESIKDTKP